MTSDEFVTISTYFTALEAHLAKGKLEAEGIEAIITDETLINTTGYSFLFGGIKLKVRKKAVDAAKKILKSD